MSYSDVLEMRLPDLRKEVGKLRAEAQAASVSQAAAVEDAVAVIVSGHEKEVAELKARVSELEAASGAPSKYHVEAERLIKSVMTGLRCDRHTAVQGLILRSYNDYRVFGDHGLIVHVKRGLNEARVGIWSI